MTKTETTVNRKKKKAELIIPQQKLAYSMAESAALTGLSYITIHRLIKRGLLKSSSALRTKVIPHTELLRFLSDTSTHSNGHRRATAA